MVVQPGLCRTWSETPKTGFLTTRLIISTLNLPRATSARIVANTFGQATGPVWLDNVGCSGTETTLKECPHNGWGNTNCAGHSEDIAVQCDTPASGPPDPGIPTTTKAPNVVQDSNCKYRPTPGLMTAYRNEDRLFR